MRLGDNREERCDKFEAEKASRFLRSRKGSRSITSVAWCGARTTAGWCPWRLEGRRSARCGPDREGVLNRRDATEYNRGGGAQISNQLDAPLERFDSLFRDLQQAKTKANRDGLILSRSAV